jgi:aryl-alcohol dehydrogenase-like predicted oxidoreductase
MSETSDLEQATTSNRRQFFQYLAALGIGSQTLWRSGDLQAAVFDARESVAMPWPEMQYRKLGRTGFNASRLVFGCGASLMRKEKDRLLNTAFEAGVNVFDVGTSRYYDNAERNMKAFLRQHNDELFLISKSFIPSPVQPDDNFTVADARAAAAGWLGFMDESLSELGVEQVDAYYLMASNNTRVIASEEMYKAFQTAKDAGKTRFLGLSTHQNAKAVLETAIETGWFDLAMIAITPGGWYDWENKNMLAGTSKLEDERPLLDRAREAGMGLIGMKAVRYFSSGFFGTSNTGAFDEFYSEKLLQAKLSAYQRSYAFVLENGLDCVNADIQNFAQLKENFIASATSHEYNATA